MSSPEFVYRKISAACLALALCMALVVAPIATARAGQATPHILGLHLVHKALSAETAQASGIPDGYIIAPSGDGSGQAYLIEEAAILTDADFAEVTSGFDQYTNRPVVRFRLKPAGTDTFAQVTGANIGRAFAIVIDGKVVSAPIIQSAINGGEGVISGAFSIEETKDLVKRMSASISD